MNEAELHVAHDLWLGVFHSPEGDSQSRGAAAMSTQTRRSSSSLNLQQLQQQQVQGGGLKNTFFECAV